jgi:hypothetical protein
MRYTDPSGHQICSDDGYCGNLGDTQYQMHGYQEAISDFDWNLGGKWSLNELKTIYQTGADISNAVGGIENMTKLFGKVDIEKKNMVKGGLGDAHHVWLNSNPNKWDKWTLAHELGHSWDASSDWNLSKNMRSSLGAGFDHPILHFLFPNNSNYWYDPGEGPPPAGLDANFNLSEDFAESFASFIYPKEASERASDRGWPYNDSSRGYTYSSFINTPRGQYVFDLIASTP